MNVVEKAREIMKEPDEIIDLYDFSIVWASSKVEKILEFSKGGLVGQRITDWFAPTETDKRAKAVEHMSKSHGFMNVDAKTKKGDTVSFEVEFYTIEFEKGFFHIGKIVNYEKHAAKK